ncbi:MAG: reverse transcriptase-like protein, partial [bacterium]|nr:reverse transcriptase-like protein [bacterium]
EYQAVKKAFEKLLTNLKELLPSRIEVRTDSQLLAHQLTGDYKVKNERLKVMVLEIKKLEERLGQVSYTQIPRSENYLADRLVNLTLDKHS